MMRLSFSIGAVLVCAVVTIASGAGDEGRMPELSGAVGWFNSTPLSANSLRGKVVLVNFWTYSCINSLRELPYVKAWAAKYKDSGLVVIGVHSPEFSFEKDPSNVKIAVANLRVAFPVPIDSEHSIWGAFRDEYWPADYIIDQGGRIRYRHFGEGDYEKSERVIQELLHEGGTAGANGGPVRINATGAEAAPSEDVRSPETYVGYQRAERFASPERLGHDSDRTYSPPASVSLNQWALSGRWTAGPESAALHAAPGKIVFRFHGRDLHMVLGPATNGKPVRFRVRLDADAPAADCGSDTAPDGGGEVREPRLYQLIRQKGPVKDRTFEIEFLDPGVRAFSFTFG